jgi:hypothetical protein
MNERIHDLAHIALNGQTFYYTAMPIGFVEKFAELIVKECIDVIGEDNYTMLTGVAYCTELKRHFGVEE